YNVLMSIEKDAILFTNGDNDTYPIWLLQRVQGIRTAVTVMNFHLITKYPDYLKKLLQERQLELDWSTLPPVKEEGFLFALCKALAPSVPVYVALTIEPAHIKPLADHLFVVGLAYQYSPRRFDNLSVLQKNWEQSFRLDYLTHDWYEAWRPETERIVPSLNGNYLAPLVLLIEHTKAKEEIEKSNRLRALAFELARKAGSGAELQRILGAR
ncbi:hypothetical protein HUU05_04145, partial [candidate division KSB1 bacterium]|nr:hypothetical protein [candidate division KSB1 bacterium]